MPPKTAVNDESVIIRCAIPRELHRHLRSILALRGEKVYEWMVRMAEEEVQAAAKENQ